MLGSEYVNEYSQELIESQNRQSSEIFQAGCYRVERVFESLKTL